MPSLAKQLELGRFVCTRPRLDGTHNVFFQVPPELRTPDFPPTVPLPFKNRRGVLDVEEVAAIRADGEQLNAELDLERVGDQQPAQPRLHSWRALADLVEKSTVFVEREPSTKYLYTQKFKMICRELEGEATLTPQTGKQAAFDAWLISKYPTQHGAYNATARALLKLTDMCAAEGQRSRDLILKFPKRGSKSKKDEKGRPVETIVRLWDQELMDTVTRRLEQHQQHDLAIVLHILFEVGCRPEDARYFRHDIDFRDGVFRFWSQKTKAWTTVPVPDATVDLLMRNYSPRGYLTLNPNSQEPWTGPQLADRYTYYRDLIPEIGEDRHQMRQLRHAAVVEYALSGATIPEIVNITRHSVSAATKVINYYLPPDSRLAWAAFEKRQARRAGAIKAQMVVEGEPRTLITDRYLDRGGRLDARPALDAEASGWIDPG